MRFAPVILLFLLLAGAARAEFAQTNLTVNVEARPDGTAHVIETVRLAMDSGSPVIYDTAMSSYDLTSWRAKTKLDIRFHFNRDIVDITDVSIRAQPRDCYGCIREDFCTSCYGTLIISYNVRPIANKSDSGLFRMNAFKPRTTNYSVNPDALSFESSGQGNTVLPDNTRLLISLPHGSIVTSINPLPEGIDGTSLQLPMAYRSPFAWAGRTTLSNFELSFQTEEPLSAEVMGFFNSIRDQALGILYSKEGVAVAFIAVIVLISVVLLTRRQES